jgi:hypothetical protein
MLDQDFSCSSSYRAQAGIQVSLLASCFPNISVPAASPNQHKGMMKSAGEE